MFAMAQEHACRDRLYARSVPQGRSIEVHPEVVRLGKFTVWRADCEIESRTSGDAATRLIHENFVQEISQQRSFVLDLPVLSSTWQKVGVIKQQPFNRKNA